MGGGWELRSTIFLIAIICQTHSNAAGMLVIGRYARDGIQFLGAVFQLRSGSFTAHLACRVVFHQRLTLLCPRLRSTGFLCDVCQDYVKHKFANSKASFENC